MRFPVLLTPLLTGAAFCVFSFCATVNGAGLQWSAVIAALDSTSPALSESRSRLAEAQAVYEAARALPNPSVSFELQNLKNNSVSEKEQSVGVHQSLGFLWSRNFEVAASLAKFQSEQAALDEAQGKITAELILAIVTMHNLIEQQNLLDSVIVAASRAKLAMDARLREGDVSEYDAQRMEAEMVEVEFRKLELDNEQRDIEQRLVNLTGLKIEILRELPAPVLSEPVFSDVQTALEFASKNRQKLNMTQMQTTSARRSLQAANKRQLPDFGVGIAKKIADPDWSGYVLEAEIEIPIWGRRTAARRLAQVNYAEAQQTRSVTEISVIGEVTAAMDRWLRAARLTASPRIYGINDALTGLNRGVRLYETGEFGALELVDALRTSMDALAASQKLQTESLAANLELRRVTGLTILE